MAAPGQGPVALNPQDADILWRLDVAEAFKIQPHDAYSNAPLVYKDRIYVATGNGVNQKHKVSDTPDAPCLMAVDTQTGRVLAQDDEKIGQRVLHAHWGSPSLAMVNGRPLILFPGGDGYVYAFDPDPLPVEGRGTGTLRKVWSYDANGGNKGAYGRANPNGPSEILATPVWRENRVYVTIGQDWTHGKGKGRLSCIDATLSGDIGKSGTLWAYEKIGRSVSTVALGEGLLFVSDTDGKLHCLDARSGAVHWVYEAGQPFWASPLLADGKVYAGTSGGKFLVFQAGKERKLLHQASAGSSFCGAPVTAPGMIFLATYKYLFALKADP
jgi:outer membrane protein assembly factor BamB